MPRRVATRVPTGRLGHDASMSSGEDLEVLLGECMHVEIFSVEMGTMRVERCFFWQRSKSFYNMCYRLL